MAKKDENTTGLYVDLSGKSLNELLEIREALGILAAHYEDRANSVVGNYPFDTQDIYLESRKLSAKYGQAYVHVTEEIERKVSAEIYA